MAGLGFAGFSSALKVGRTKRIFSALGFLIQTGTTLSLSIILIDSICQGRGQREKREKEREGGRERGISWSQSLNSQSPGLSLLSLLISP